ncbi:serine hydrolase domain-containing protein [Streptomyces hygroscopicus]|uniref:serine hydrolase domain-containing protein n=1 Tax=Streptomyces hygroscopicus TaxID=1912 RepID=UPI0036402FC4
MKARRGSDNRFGAAGVADRAAGRPMTPDLKFRTGSVAKTFTATVVLQLVAEHRLRLDDTVQSLLPDQVRTDNALSGAPITVRQLLNHTSGLYDYIDGLLPHFRRLDQYWPRDQLISTGLAQPRYFPAPGTRFRYSNTNYLLLDLIVERITDRDLRTNLERRVLAPLGLPDTSYPLAQTAIDGAHVHGYTDVSLLLPNAPDPTRFDVTAFSPSEAGAPGALVTTAADIARFYRALLQGRLLPPDLLRRMLTDTVPTTGSAPPAVAYGLGAYVYATGCGRGRRHRDRRGFLGCQAAAEEPGARAQTRDRFTVTPEVRHLLALWKGNVAAVHRELTARAAKGEVDPPPSIPTLHRAIRRDLTPGERAGWRAGGAQTRCVPGPAAGLA